MGEVGIDLSAHRSKFVRSIEVMLQRFCVARDTLRALLDALDAGACRNPFDLGIG